MKTVYLSGRKYDRYSQDIESKYTSIRVPVHNAGRERNKKRELKKMSLNDGGCGHI